mmetsp:Transcript_113436/g.284115  ORF Transcript_113436/g.284115 Transcript_113436/m.284115 type:complete len:201 (+) Transcript_113436:316-918(+)
MRCFLCDLDQTGQGCVAGSPHLAIGALGNAAVDRRWQLAAAADIVPPDSPPAVHPHSGWAGRWWLGSGRAPGRDSHLVLCFIRLRLYRSCCARPHPHCNGWRWECQRARGCESPDVLGWCWWMPDRRLAYSWSGQHSRDIYGLSGGADHSAALDYDHRGAAAVGRLGFHVGRHFSGPGGLLLLGCCDGYLCSSDDRCVAG